MHSFRVHLPIALDTTKEINNLFFDVWNIILNVTYVLQIFHFPECGVSGAFNRRQPRNLSSLEHGRIINGKESPKGAWPWQVSMLLQFCVLFLNRLHEYQHNKVKSVM
jgi:hypothetical protein